MKIERLETIPYALSFREPYVTARGRLERRELVLVWISAGGQVGLGEAAPLLLRGGPPLEQIAADLGRCRALLEGAEIDVDDWSALAARCRDVAYTRQALAAVELALLDLCGKLSGRPAWSLLGADRASRVACNATLTAGDPEQVAEQARRWAARGFTTFKLKIGMDGDVEQVAAVREALGPSVLLRLDANGAWTFDQALARLRELEPFGIELVEQPVGELSELARVRRETDVPIAADESVATVEDAHEALAQEACDLATVKIAKAGGVTAIRAIADVLPVYLSSALDGPVGIAAAAHVAQVLPEEGPGAGLAQGLATAELFEHTIASTECRVVDAALTPGDSPGLGVEIDDFALAEARI